MIAKQEWFKRRKYTGWGLTPSTWQGWLYVLIIILPFIVMEGVIPDLKIRMYITGGWLTVILIDVTHIMFTIKKDEREFKIEAISERNAAWAMVLTIGAGIIYQVITGTMAGEVRLDPLLLIVLIAGVAAKAFSNIILEKKAL